MQRLGFESRITSRASPERDAVCATFAARILSPQTNLATTRWWHATLPEELGVVDADENALYAPMDWLLERQGTIQKKLAAQHLSAGGGSPCMTSVRAPSQGVGEDRLRP
jgi:hypothetical protein